MSEEKIAMQPGVNMKEQDIRLQPGRNKQKLEEDTLNQIAGGYGKYFKPLPHM